MFFTRVWRIMRGSVHDNASPEVRALSVAGREAIWPNLVRAERGAIGDRLARFHPDIERDRRKSRRPNLNPVRAGFEVQMLEHAVEVVDDAHVIAIREHLRVSRRVDDPDAAVQAAGDNRQVSGRRHAVVAVAVRVTVAIGGISVPVSIWIGVVPETAAERWAVVIRTIRSDRDDAW